MKKNTLFSSGIFNPGSRNLGWENDESPHPNSSHAYLHIFDENGKNNNLIRVIMIRVGMFHNF